MNYRALPFILSFLLMFLSAGPVMAAEEHGLTVAEALAPILAEQSVDDPRDLDCDRISAERFEQLGDAYMSLRHPDEEEHEAMDAMMGGEGSESLRLMHENMGRAYLGCGEYGSFGMMGGGMMMESGMMRPGLTDIRDKSMFRGMGPAYGMHGFDAAFPFVGWVTVALTWAFLGLGAAAFYRYLKKK